MKYILILFLVSLSVFCLLVPFRVDIPQKYSCDFDLNILNVWCNPSRDSFGLTAGDNQWQESADVANCMQFTMCSSAGELVNIRVRVPQGAPEGDIRAAIYRDTTSGADHYPGYKVWGDDTGIESVYGWVTWSMSGDNLEASGTYWLCYIQEVSNYIKYQSSAGLHAYQAWVFESAWPSYFSTTGWSTNTNQYVMHAVVEISEGEDNYSGKFPRGIARGVMR